MSLQVIRVTKGTILEILTRFVPKTGDKQGAKGTKGQKGQMGTNGDKRETKGTILVILTICPQNREQNRGQKGQRDKRDKMGTNGDKRGQKGTKGDKIVPFVPQNGTILSLLSHLSPLKFPAYREIFMCW
jgi:hypothetical protein